MKIHNYAPGNGTLYRLGLDSVDGNHLLIWLNPSHCYGGVCADLGSYPSVNWDTLEKYLGAPSLADVAAILGWLKQKWSFSGRLPDGFDINGVYTG